MACTFGKFKDGPCYRKLRSMCIATREIMDCMFEAYMGQDGNDPVDIPQTKDPVLILGRKYNALKDLTEIRLDIQSFLWFTYRKGFVPIGNAEGPTSDRGWGCMLRCGQMVLAQAFILEHLGRDWRWDLNCRDPIYLKILKRFEDNRQSPFSIHQIASMGESEGKEIGQWFGPNTVAQVLKKLLKYDDWSQIVMHIALDNTVVINNIRKLCYTNDDLTSRSTWRPLLLIVPLRLGLTEINPIYLTGLKTCFRFNQSLGVIGGKPNLALYFIGCVGDEVIYLDPHTTQKVGNVDNKQNGEQIDMDSSYHCKRASRMNILAMDPSVAVCFFCNTEDEFIILTTRIREELIKPEKQPLFELCHEPPKQYSPVLDLTAIDVIAAHSNAGAVIADRQYDSENEFEIL